MGVEMSATRWQNRSPGDLSIALPEIIAGDVETAIAQGCAAAPAWAQTPLPERIARLRAAQEAITAAKDDLAHGIALETGKPITEAQGEVGAVIAKIDLTTGPAASTLYPGRIRFDERGRRIGAVPLIVQWQNGEPFTVVPVNLATRPVVWHK